jgi:hypothetical protein
MALGIEDKWINRFEGIYQNYPNWYNNNNKDFSVASLISDLQIFFAAVDQIIQINEKNYYKN